MVDAAAGSEPEQKQFTVQKVYLKDSSFESPRSPAIFQGEWKPNVDINLSSKSNRVTEHVHEAIISITVTAKVDDEVAFLCEIHQAGLFYITGYSDEELKQLLGSYCAGFLYPYAGESVNQLVSRGGFPHIYLQPLNFDAVFSKHKEQVEQANVEAEQVAERH